MVYRNLREKAYRILNEKYLKTFNSHKENKIPVINIALLPNKKHNN